MVGPLYLRLRAAQEAALELQRPALEFIALRPAREGVGHVGEAARLFRGERDAPFAEAIHQLIDRRTHAARSRRIVVSRPELSHLVLDPLEHLALAVALLAQARRHSRHRDGD